LNFKASTSEGKMLRDFDVGVVQSPNLRE
jgi:hypothetical protein